MAVNQSYSLSRLLVLQDNYNASVPDNLSLKDPCMILGNKVLISIGKMESNSTDCSIIKRKKYLNLLNFQSASGKLGPLFTLIKPPLWTVNINYF